MSCEPSSKVNGSILVIDYSLDEATFVGVLGLSLKSKIFPELEEIGAFGIIFQGLGF